MNRFRLFFFVSISLSNVVFAFAQTDVDWSDRAQMPEPVSNNAVADYLFDGQVRMVSFGGIDETKAFDGIHNKVFIYFGEQDLWVPLGEMPDPRGRIAPGASVVGDIVYVMGGYEVFANGSELSLDLNHRFDIKESEFIADGAAIPIPIDDHVQAVYRDSLIYIVSGWSQNGNIPDVQIYDTHNDSWQVGTPVPNTDDYKGFGLSGAIVGDTLYYIGGADFSFLPPFIRKGYIHPEDPTQIDWSLEENELAAVYRPAVSTFGDNVLWFGGSTDSYNFDGLSYSNNSGVEPSTDIIKYEPQNGELTKLKNVLPPIMDLRGMGSASGYMLCGGMSEGQEVSNKTFAIDFIQAFSGLEEISISPSVNIYPNPTADFLHLDPFDSEATYEVLTSEGRNMAIVVSERIDISSFQAGTYFLKKQGKLISKFVKY